jgi:hypothetical protein
MEEPVVKRPVGRPTRFPGKPLQCRLTVSLTPACREHIESLARRMSCSLSDVVEYSVWQQGAGSPIVTSTGGLRNE